MTGARASAAETRWSSSLLPIAIITGAGLLIAVAIGVRGDFPLSDDWSYGHAVRALCDDGRLDLLAWTGPTLVLQAWVGAALCRMFGFSFTALRCATLAAGVAGAVGFYLLAREYRRAPPLLALATIAFALDPLYLNLAFTFMTDVPFVALAVWASLYYVRGLGRADLGRLALGSCFCAAAVLVRQQALFVAAAAAGAVLIVLPGPASAKLRAVVAATALPAVVLIGYLVWLFGVHGAPPAVTIRLAQQSAFDPVTLVNVGYRSLAYLGLLALPLAIAAAPDAWRQAPRLTGAAGVLIAATAGARWIHERALMFYLRNTLYDFGVGPLTLRDTQFLGLEPPLHGGDALRLAVTIAAAAGATVLLAAAGLAATRRRDPAATFALAAFACSLAGAILTQSRLYLDRHVLPALPFALLLALPLVPPRRPGWGAWTAALALAWYAVAGTHDYLAWNGARFALLDALEARGTDARQIDGGVEYNGWRLAADLGTWPTMEEARVGQPATRRSWWWVVDDRFVVSFRPLDGYRVADERAYRRWLIPGHGRVLLLERENGASTRADRGAT